MSDIAELLETDESVANLSDKNSRLGILVWEFRIA